RQNELHFRSPPIGACALPDPASETACRGFGGDHVASSAPTKPLHSWRLRRRLQRIFMMAGGSNLTVDTQPPEPRRGLEGRSLARPFLPSTAVSHDRRRKLERPSRLRFASRLR